jgi:hypothetical protein
MAGESTSTTANPSDEGQGQNYRLLLSDWFSGDLEDHPTPDFDGMIARIGRYPTQPGWRRVRRGTCGSPARLQQRT